MLGKHMSKSRAISSEMKYLRKDLVRNTTIREILKMGSIVGDRDKNLKWCGNLIRMNNERKTKQVYED